MRFCKSGTVQNFFSALKVAAELRQAWRTGEAPIPTQALFFVPRCGVVTAARLDSVVRLPGLDLDFAERAVAVAVGRHVTSVVLAAEFLGNLVEGLAELFDLVADFDHAASGFLGKLFHV